MSIRRLSTGIVCTRRGACGIELLFQFKKKLKGWEFPGGKLDGTETIKECAIRELKEEVGLTALDLDFITYFDMRDRYCCMMFHVSLLNVEEDYPVLREPDKQSAIGWFPIDDLPTPLVGYCKDVINLGIFESVKKYYENLHA